MTELTHFDSDGNARMVDVGDKDITVRKAIAGGVVRMKIATADLIAAGSIDKGDVLGIARTAGIMGCKLTPNLIPLCHGLAADSVSIDFDWCDADPGYRDLQLRCTVTATGKTGVEMEALAAVSIAALTVYDMCKSVDREMEIRSICLLEKSGGKSGHFIRSNTKTED